MLAIRVQEVVKVSVASNTEDDKLPDSQTSSNNLNDEQIIENKFQKFVSHYTTNPKFITQALPSPISIPSNDFPLTVSSSSSLNSSPQAIAHSLLSFRESSSSPLSAGARSRLESSPVWATGDSDWSFIDIAWFEYFKV